MEDEESYRCIEEGRTGVEGRERALCCRKPLSVVVVVFLGVSSCCGRIRRDGQTSTSLHSLLVRPVIRACIRASNTSH